MSLIRIELPTLKRRTETSPRRDTFRALYQSARWHRFSKDYLKKNRLCILCLDQGKTEIAKQVDHITALVQWIGSPYDLSNLQPLCRSCHSKKTRDENK